MIYGIGIDIVNIERMKRAVEKWGNRFLERVFTEMEISYCYEKRNPFLSLAVRFAAKEALIKAVGSINSISLKDIEVVNVDGGKPILRLRGKFNEFFQMHKIEKVHLSLSHEYDYGIACVVLEQGEIGEMI
ncbi:MAG: holo-ACP synthase [Nitrospirae bacterium]|nr:holo-ACP synthase [Nitrospirota bacterium]